MPASAIDTVPVDFVAPAAEIGAAIQRLMRTPLPAPPDGDAGGPRDDVSERALEGGGALEMHGRPSRFTCPDCGGSLWDASAEEPGKFRCRVGHSWTTAGLVERQALTLEQALWTALRALSERADLARRLRDQAAARNHEHGRELFDRQLEEYEQRADVIREVLRSPEPAAHLPAAVVRDVAPSAATITESTTPDEVAL
jgi:two-component system chemotaxis response regulator CheB